MVYAERANVCRTRKQSADEAATLAFAAASLRWAAAHLRSLTCCSCLLGWFFTVVV